MEGGNGNQENKRNIRPGYRLKMYLYKEFEGLQIAPKMQRK